MDRLDKQLNFGIYNADQTSGYYSHGAVTTGGSSTENKILVDMMEVILAHLHKEMVKSLLQQGNEDGHYYFRCQGTGSTGVGISEVGILEEYIFQMTMIE